VTSEDDVRESTLRDGRHCSPHSCPRQAPPPPRASACTSTAPSGVDGCGSPHPRVRRRASQGRGTRSPPGVATAREPSPKTTWWWGYILCASPVQSC